MQAKNYQKLSFIEVNLLEIKAFPYKESFEIKENFFEAFGGGITPIGSFRVDIELTKTVQGYQADIDVKGAIEAECARSLELFNYPISLEERVFFRLSDYNEDMGEDLILLNRSSETLNLDQVVYDKIALSIPLRLVHPKFGSEDEDYEDGVVLYTTEIQSESEQQMELESPKETEEIDPRWSALFKLKKDNN